MATDRNRVLPCTWWLQLREKAQVGNRDEGFLLGLWVWRGWNCVRYNYHHNNNHDDNNHDDNIHNIHNDDNGNDNDVQAVQVRCLRQGLVQRRGHAKRLCRC